MDKKIWTILHWNILFNNIKFPISETSIGECCACEGRKQWMIKLDLCFEMMTSNLHPI